MRQFAVLILAAALSANVCAENAADMPMKWATPVKQDANLYRLDDKLYRSEQLTRSDAAAEFGHQKRHQPAFFRPRR